MLLTSTSSYLSPAVQLYEQAFPRCERRDTAQWVKLIASHPAFRVEAIEQGGGFAGFISYWEFSTFCYVEHFAVASNLRGGGIGGKAIEALIRAQAPKPLVLEIEPPADALTRRRHDFYARHGLHLSTAPYLQPPYHADEAPLPLALMTTDSDFLAHHLDEVINTVHRQVYGVKSSLITNHS